MASLVFDSVSNDAFRAKFDIGVDTIYALLLANTYTPNKGTHAKRSDLSGELAASGGYVVGGFVIAAAIGAIDTVNHWMDITCGGFTISNATLTARYAAYYKRRGGAASADELLFLNDFGSDIVASSAPFILPASTFRVKTL